MEKVLIMLVVMHTILMLFLVVFTLITVDKIREYLDLVWKETKSTHYKIDTLENRVTRLLDVVEEEP